MPCEEEDGRGREEKEEEDKEDEDGGNDDDDGGGGGGGGDDDDDDRKDEEDEEDEEDEDDEEALVAMDLAEVLGSATGAPSSSMKCRLALFKMDLAERDNLDMPVALAQISSTFSLRFVHVHIPSDHLCRALRCMFQSSTMALNPAAPIPYFFSAATSYTVRWNGDPSL